MNNIEQQLKKTFNGKYNFYFHISIELYEKVRIPFTTRIRESFRLNIKTMENIKKEIIK